ncbi:MAG: hypothetical protein IJZ88_01605 [Clostridia bacterium]|nr:hypothetical protein [Clostridia bacterium]
MAVNKVVVFKRGFTYPICPRCQVTLEREYVHYCDRCGQCLCWSGFSKAEIVKKF